LNTGVAKKQPKLKKTELGENNMKISQEGIALIKVFEGCKLESYLCAAGVWTIGYGHTKMVEEGQEITQEEADNILLNQHQFDALVSWTFNLGGANLNASTMLKVINKGEYEDVPAQIKRWNKAGGKVLQGLIRRREAEALLFEGKDWENGTK